MGRALIVSAGANSNEYIAARLSEMGYSRPVIIPSGAEARRRMSESDFELIVVNAPLPDEFGHELCITAVEQTDAGVVFLVKAAQAEQLLAPLNEQGVLLLSKPFTTPLFLQAMHMAAAGNHRLQRLRQENARLQDKIGQLRLISRAKCCLVEHAHMTEAEAHRYLEKQAMDTRRDRAEVAQEVLRGLREPVEAAGGVLAVQCCEHLNRALVLPRAALETPEDSARCISSMAVGVVTHAGIRCLLPGESAAGYTGECANS